MEYISWILTTSTLAGVFGTVAGTFYGVRQKTIIRTLELSNTTYRERNAQLEQEYARLKKEYAEDIAQLKGRVHALEQLKTPDITSLKQVLNTNHRELLDAIKSKGNGE